MIRAAYRAFYVAEQGMRTRYFATKRELRSFLAECRHAKIKAWEPRDQKLVTVVMPTIERTELYGYPTPPKKKGKEKKVLSSVAEIRAQQAGLRRVQDYNANLAG
jgi:hypothetical protein